MSELTQDAVREALKDLRLPDSRPLVASGRLSGIGVSGTRVDLSIATNPAEAPAMAALRAEAEARLRRLPGVSQAFVVLTAEAPGAAKPQTPQPPQLTPPAGKADPLANVRTVIAVASGKGGVGKSTTAVNLALAFRAQGLSVGILDADIHGPSLPTLLGLHGKPHANGRKLVPLKAFGLHAMSMGLMVDAETAMIWRGPMVMSAITQMMADVDWGALDMLVVDMPPGTGDAQLALAQGTRLAGAVIVSTPQDLSLIDARRGISMFRKMDVPVLGIVENMSHFICPDCGGAHPIFGQGGAEAEAARIGVPFLGAVPLTMELRAASDAGQPILARDPDGALGRIYQDIARTVLARLGERTRADASPRQPQEIPT